MASVQPGSVFNWVFMGPLLISFNRSGQVPADRWKEFIIDAGSRTFTHGLGAAMGAIEINSVQRREAAAVLKDKRTAVVSDHAVSRGIVTALSWFGLEIKSYDWTHVEEAVDFLAVPGLAKSEVVRALLELRDTSMG